MSDVFVMVSWNGQFGFGRNPEAPLGSRDPKNCVYIVRSKILTVEDQKSLAVGSHVTGTREPDLRGRTDHLVDVEIVPPTEAETEAGVRRFCSRALGTASPYRQCPASLNAPRPRWPVFWAQRYFDNRRRDFTSGLDDSWPSYPRPEVSREGSRNRYRNLHRAGRTAMNDQEVDRKIKEQVNQAARVRASLAHASQCKTLTEYAVAHKSIPGTETGGHNTILPKVKNNGRHQ